MNANERRSVHGWVCTVLGAIALATTSAGAAQRIASLNLCTDQTLLLLAERERIVSITWLGADPHESPLAALAEGIAVNYGHAEELIPLRPDLILAGTYGARFTVRLLRERGYPLEQIPPATDIATVRENLLRVGRWVGRVERAERLLVRFDTELMALAPSDSRRPSALFFGARGYSAGLGTLAHQLLETVGFTNQARRYDMEGGGFVDLETLLLDPPDVLVVADDYRHDTSLATHLFDHPAVARLTSTIVPLPSRLISCSPPALIDAAHLLAQARRRWLEQAQ